MLVKLDHFPPTRDENIIKYILKTTNQIIFFHVVFGSTLTMDGIEHRSQKTDWNITSQIIFNPKRSQRPWELTTKNFTQNKQLLGCPKKFGKGQDQWVISYNPNIYHWYIGELTHWSSSFTKFLAFTHSPQWAAWASPAIPEGRSQETPWSFKISGGVVGLTQKHGHMWTNCNLDPHVLSDFLSFFLFFVY